MYVISVVSHRFGPISFGLRAVSTAPLVSSTTVKVLTEFGNPETHLLRVPLFNYPKIGSNPGVQAYWGNEPPGLSLLRSQIVEPCIL